MPGYTHLQRAQPVLFAHHMLAYFEMLGRDAERFRQARVRADVLPLGSGALAGVPYPVDRDFVARELGLRGRVGEQHGRRLRPGLPARLPLGIDNMRRPPFAHGRGAGPLVVGRVRVCSAGRRLHDRQQHHAAEAQPRLRGAGPRQDRQGVRQPGGDAHRAQGPAADLQPRPAGGQGGAVRHGRHDRADAAGDGGHALHHGGAARQPALRRAVRVPAGDRRRRLPCGARDAVPGGARRGRPHLGAGPSGRARRWPSCRSRPTGSSRRCSRATCCRSR